MALVHSFPPIAGEDASVLILGSMPGVESLRADQYYAHPRNAFWGILSALFDAAPITTYAEKRQLLLSRRIALWDVLQSCARAGSLDAAIDKSSIVVNDFTAFFHAHRRIDAVFFNGAQAAQTFQRHVLPRLARDHALAFRQLPSTSPAHASLSFAGKLEAWRALRQWV